MMQLVVPETLSFPCAKLVKAMAALISFQYVSSLPFTFSFCAAPTPPLPLMINGTRKHAQERTKQRVFVRGVTGQVQLVMNEKRGFDPHCKVRDCMKMIWGGGQKRGYVFLLFVEGRVD